MPVLGIDLGRASCSAVVKFADAETPDDFALHLEPIVALSPSGEWLVGDSARRAATIGSGQAVWDLLVLQGRKISDFSPAQLASWPFRLVPGIGGKAFVEFQAKASASVPRTVFAPEELLAVLFARVRQLAEQRAGTSIEETVLTIPTTYHYTQRRAIRDTCAMAGLHVRRLVVSATAAALAHILPLGDQAVGELWLVVDFGAGSVDALLVAAQKGRTLEVKAVAGDASIGGLVLTERIVSHFLRDVHVHTAVATAASLNRLRRASQLAKKILSTSDAASVQLQIDSGAFAGSITRAQFDAACSDCWRRVEELLQLVLLEGRTTSDQVNGVLLCGGSAALPALREMIERVFPMVALDVTPTGNLQAHGAAMLAASLLRAPQSPLLLDVTPLAFGVQRVASKDVAILIPANVRVPARGDSVFFVGSHVTELVYCVLEGRQLRQATANPHTHVPGPHCIGTIQALPAPAVLTTAPTLVVTKLSIAFDLTEDLQLTCSIANLATKQTTTTTFLGDESALPRDAIARTKTELDRVFRGHLRVDEPPSDVIHYTDSTAALQAYAQTLRQMVDAKTLVVTISDDDAQLVTAKIDELLEWVRSSPPISLASHNSNRNSSTAEENSDASNGLLYTDVPAHARLQALRRLHWNVAASAAIAHLRSAEI